MPKFSDLRSTIWRYAQRPGPSTLNTNLIASWPLDDQGTFDRQDFAGSELDLTNINGATNFVGDSGTRFVWSSQQRLETDFATAPVLYGSATDDFSIAVSFKVISWPVTSGLITPIVSITNFTTARGWMVGVLPDTVSPARGATFHTTTNGSDTLRIDGPVITLNTWNHYIFRFDSSDVGSEYKLYVNGEASTPVSNAAGFHRPTTIDFNVASYVNTGANRIHGDVAVKNINMWDRTLTDEEVLEWYNGGEPLSIPFI